MKTLHACKMFMILLTLSVCGCKTVTSDLGEDKIINLSLRQKRDEILIQESTKESRNNTLMILEKREDKERLLRVDDLMDQAILSLVDREYKQAEALVHQAIYRDPDAERVVYTYGLTLWAMGNCDRIQAEANSFKNAAIFSVFTDQCQLLRGEVIYLDTQKPVLDLASGVNRAIQLLSLNRYAEAEKELDILEKKGHRNVDLYILLAMIKTQNGRFKESDLIYESLSKKVLSRPWVKQHFAILLASRGQLEEARELLLQLYLATDQVNPDPRLLASIKRTTDWVEELIIKKNAKNTP